MIKLSQNTSFNLLARPGVAFGEAGWKSALPKLK
jgi:hypothetical protein